MVSSGDLDLLFKSYTNASHEELLGIAQDCLSRLAPFFEQCNVDCMDGYLLNFIATAIASDGCLTRGEYDFFCELTGCDKPFEQVGEKMALYDNAEAVEQVKAVFDAVPDDLVREDLIKLLLAVFASDDVVAFNESLLFLNFIL